MQQDVAAYISSCNIGKETKYLPKAPCELLQPILPLIAIWEAIAIDFIVSLPAYQGNTVIIVVIVRLSKAAHFGGLPTNILSCTAAELFTNIICKLHGYPKSIISDQNPIFMSKFWQSSYQLNRTKLLVSKAYHL